MREKKLSLAIACVIFLFISMAAYADTQNTVYTNPRFSISINCPKNWRVALEDNILEGRYGPEGVLVKFRKRSGPYSPYLSLSLVSALKMLREDWKAQEMMEHYLQGIQEKYAGKFNLVESAQDTFVNDIPAVQVIYDVVMGLGIEFRERVIYLRKNEFFIELIASAPREVFINYDPDFSYAINSLKLE